MFCTSCGEELEDDARFCTHCGAKISEQDKARLEAAEASSKDKGLTADTHKENAAAASTSSSQASEAQTQPSEEQARSSSGKPTIRNRKIITIASAVIVAVVAMVLVVVGVSSCSSQAVAIDSDTFPNDQIRDAVMLELDADGDGSLSPEEADAVAGIVVTPKGAAFVKEDDETDFANIRKALEAKDASDTSASLASDANTMNNDARVSTNAEDLSRSLEPFSKMKNLVVADMGITDLDLGNLSELEYVDCRNNPIETLDLSNCKNLVSLFCDDGVELIGLDSAGLYYRDLISSVAESGKALPIVFSYDAMGRILQYGDGSSVEKVYSYDEYGRLVRAQNGSSEGAWYETYSYGENGLLFQATVFQPLSVGEAPHEFTYEYDDKNRLVEVAKTRTGEMEAEARIEYADNVPSSIKTLDATMTLVATDKGRISQVDRTDPTSGADLGTYAYNYLEDGQLAGLNTTDMDASASGARALSLHKTLKTSFSDSDQPLFTTVEEGASVGSSNTSLDIRYETNADGYITHMETPSNGGRTLLSESMLDISYIKHVGKLEDLPAQRYVPVFRVANTSNPLEVFAWCLNQDLYASTGSKDVISIIEDGPMQMTLQPLGITANAVSNPNEQKLADYMNEHCQDPFELKPALGIVATDPSTFGEAQSQEPPNNTEASEAESAALSARTVTTDHFTFVMPKSWADKVTWTMEEHTNAGAATDGSDQRIYQYFFYVHKEDVLSNQVLSIMVTNDATGELGQTNVINEFKTADGLQGYVCYWDSFLMAEGSPNSNAATITSLQSGGEVQYSPSFDNDERKACNHKIEEWLKANVVPQIKPL